MLEDAVLGVNWGDYFILIQDQPFWEAELAQLEDCRDFMNELGEVQTRASGLMGTGIGAGEKIDNMEEIAAHCGKFYEEMLEKYPEFKPKVEQVVGNGMSILRQKAKFRFGS